MAARGSINTLVLIVFCFSLSYVILEKKLNTLVFILNLCLLV